jgi:hypothetical protein
MSSRHRFSLPTSSAQSWRHALLPVWMLVALALVSGLAYWDEERESKAALEDFAAEQSTLASSLAAGLSAHLAASRPAPAQPIGVATNEDGEAELAHARAALWAAVGRIEHPGESLVLLQPPGSTNLRGTDGRTVTSATLSGALESNRASIGLTRKEAAALGLSERTAYAGLADIDAGACRRRRRRVPLSPESPVPRDPPAGAETVFRDVLSGGDAHEGGALGSMALRSAVSSPLRGEIGIRLGRCDSLSRARSAPRAR